MSSRQGRGRRRECVSGSPWQECGSLSLSTCLPSAHLRGGRVLTYVKTVAKENLDKFTPSTFQSELPGMKSLQKGRTSSCCTDEMVTMKWLAGKRNSNVKLTMDTDLFLLHTICTYNIPYGSFVFSFPMGPVYAM